MPRKPTLVALLTLALAALVRLLTRRRPAAAEPLPPGSGTAVTVLVGSDDRLTPASHSRAMAAAIGPSCRLVVVPGAGHSVNITRYPVVDAELLDLVDRVDLLAIR